MTPTETTVRAVRAATTVAAEPRRAAFFDVDETLIAAKSMFAFWDHWSARGGKDGRDAEDGSHGMPPSPTDRAALNRAHFLRYRGASPDELNAAGQEWYATYRTTPSAFVTASLSALRRHRAAGHTVVLVSGSATPMLRPLADDLGAEAVLCTELLVGDDGLLTGDVRTPMIGGAKATAVAAYLARHELSAADSHAYGDHASDLDMLRAVGNPVVVGDDPELTHWAVREGWPRLPSATGPGGRRPR